MRIALIAPSMMLSFDGVADYAENLARGLQARGHTVLQIGLNDFHDTARTFAEEREGRKILNLSAYSGWPERRERLAATLAEFKPDAVSVQYYWRGWWVGRHHGSMAALLRQVCGPRCRRHIMFHETWEEVSNATRLPLFARHFGVALTMISFYQRLRPQAAFTNTGLFARQLRRLGVTAEIAPVCSAIPVSAEDAGARAALWAQIEAAGAGTLARGAAWVVVMFGRLPPDWEAAEAMRWLTQARVASGRPEGVLVSIGKTAYGDEGWKLAAAAARAAGFRTTKLGLQDTAVVSQLMQLGDIGVVTTRGELLGKSTTYATMRQHGLPIFLVDHRNLPADDISFVTPGEGFAASLAAARRRPMQADSWAGLVEHYGRVLGAG